MFATEPAWPPEAEDAALRSLPAAGGEPDSPQAPPWEEPAGHEQDPLLAWGEPQAPPWEEPPVPLWDEPDQLWAEPYGAFRPARRRRSGRYRRAS